MLVTSLIFIKQSLIKIDFPAAPNLEALLTLQHTQETMATPIFSIYAVDYDGGAIVHFSHMDMFTSFFEATKKAVEMSVGLAREFVIVPELMKVQAHSFLVPECAGGIYRFSKTNPSRILGFSEICLKNCFHVVNGRFHFKQMMTASPVLRQTLYLDSVLFPDFTLAFPLSSPVFA